MRTMKRVMLILWVSMFSFSIGAAVNNEDRNQLQANDGNVGSKSQTLKKLGQWGSAPFIDIVVNGNYAYCAAGFAGLEILDISDRSHPVRVAGIEASFSIDNICFNNGFIYASANGPRGRTGSLEIIDLRDPLKPRKRGGKAVGIDCRAIAVQGDYVYLSETSDSTGFEEGIVVFNVSNPDLPVQVGFFRADSKISMYVITMSTH